MVCRRHCLSQPRQVMRIDPSTKYMLAPVETHSTPDPSDLTLPVCSRKVRDSTVITSRFVLICRCIPIADCSNGDKFPLPLTTHTDNKYTAVDEVNGRTRRRATLRRRLCTKNIKLFRLSAPPLRFAYRYQPPHLSLPQFSHFTANENTCQNDVCSYLAYFSFGTQTCSRPTLPRHQRFVSLYLEFPEGATYGPLCVYLKSGRLTPLAFHELSSWEILIPRSRSTDQ